MSLQQIKHTYVFSLKSFLVNAVLFATVVILLVVLNPRFALPILIAWSGVLALHFIFMVSHFVESRQEKTKGFTEKEKPAHVILGDDGELVYGVEDSKESHQQSRL